MEFYNLGLVTWFESQVIYHALAHLGREALILCTPATPYVCAGFHQDLASEVDLKTCRENGIPLFRREAGGGLVYLDNRQAFFQIVLHRKNPTVPVNRERFYRKFLEPVVQTLGDFNLGAELRPPCDLIINSKKISGNGAGQIGECYMLIGNILLDFNYEAMTSIIRVPSENFRQEYLQQMQTNITTLQSETNRRVSIEDVMERLKSNFAKIFPLTPTRMDSEVEQKVYELTPIYQSEEWLLEPGRRLPFREIKVAENCYIREHSIHLRYTDLTCLLVLTNDHIAKIKLHDSKCKIPSCVLQRLEYSLLGKTPDFLLLSKAISAVKALSPSETENMSLALSSPWDYLKYSGNANQLLRTKAENSSFPQFR